MIELIIYGLGILVILLGLLITTTIIGGIFVAMLKFTAYAIDKIHEIRMKIRRNYWASAIEKDKNKKN